jgi:hypothetical protein
VTKSEVLAKVRKLLALSKSDNPHEAGVASALATKLLTKHDLSVGELDTPEDDLEDCQEWADPLVSAADAKKWLRVFAHGLCAVFGCYCYQKLDGPVVVVGRASNVETVRYLVDWVKVEIERLAKAQRGNGRSYIIAYRKGAASIILEAIKAERIETVEAARLEAGSSLVAIDNAVALCAERALEARAWAKAHVPGLRSKGGSRVNASGYAAGRRDGAGVYGGRRAQIGAGSRRIGGGS